MQHRIFLRAFIALAVSFTALWIAHAQTHDEPETVLVTYHPKSGQEEQFLEVLKRDWATLSRLKLVDEEPHVVVRAKDDSGKTIFVEVFTWVSGETPDHVPAEVQSIWTEMQKLVETRDGHPGVEFRAVTSVTVK